MKKKAYLAVHFTKGCFYQCDDRKVVGLMPKYYLLAGDESQVSTRLFEVCDVILKVKQSHTSAV